MDSLFETIACVRILNVLVGTFDNTLLIFGSDHGSWVGDFRLTRFGRIEARLPLQLLVFPKWFKKEHKSLYETVKVIFSLKTSHKYPSNQLRSISHLAVLHFMPRFLC